MDKKPDASKVLSPTRKNTWAHDNPEARIEVYDGLWAGESVSSLVRRTGCPQRTVSGILSAITKYRNKKKREESVRLADCLLVVRVIM